MRNSDFSEKYISKVIIVLKNSFKNIIDGIPTVVGGKWNDNAFAKMKTFKDH